LAIPAPEEKGNVVIQTWGIIAALNKGVDHSEVPPSVYTSSKVDSLFREHIDTTTSGNHEGSDINHINDDLYIAKDVFEPWLQKEDDSSVGTIDPTSLITIEGSPELRSKIKKLLSKYKGIFSNELSDEPARIPEFELVVDKTQWETYNNRGPPRVQSPAKEAEIFRQVDALLKRGIIEPSNSSHYSQVILASKPDDTWRFCIDYRKLNDCTKSPSWPIPNIKSMFSRLGTQGSDVFGVMDLTSGYHQAPVSLLTRAFLAFICFCGIYQFTRLPFGPKRAPSYFQEMMASVVLHGLIYKICEMYLDDCIVHAKGENEFLIRLEEVFLRFQKYNIFLKASKCKFGMSKVDYCGKVISEQGLSMTLAKTQTALNFPKPSTHGALKKFVGLANYFHDFVAHHSHIMKPLHDMLENYSKKTRTRLLIWTPEANLSWDLILIEIGKNHTMYFPDANSPIFLMTDASDYGIGSYCFQRVDNKEQPVAFVSKSLSKSQLNWAIIQKEAFAIFYSLQQLSSILRDRTFTVLTDHRNLKFIENHSNPMIYRWWVSIQEFDFILKDILGKDNEVADGFSRLVKNEMTDKQLLITAMLIATPMSQEVFNMISSVHNSVNGHHGVDRTMKCLSRIDDSKHIKNLRAYVHLFIKKCPFCQKIDMLKFPIHASPFTTSTYYPMECLNIDFIGPFHDKKYILVIIDAFSRWVELYLCSAATAGESARCLFEHFGRFGAPRQIRSDRGSHFANATIAEFLTLVGTEHCLTLSYSSQQNAIVERVNKEINRHIKAWIYDANNLENYHLSIPIVQRILNSAYSDRTGISSANLLFGGALDLDRGIFLPLSERPIQDVPLSTTISNMLAFQDRIMAQARTVLMETDKLHMAKLQGKSITTYSPDSFVLVRYRKGAPPSRLHTNWRGPMRVISNNKSIHMLLDLITNKEVAYHVYDIKPFIFDPRQTNPIDVARHDYLEFFVENILSMKGIPKRLTSLHFLVKWVGYDETHNSWEPWVNLRDLSILHTYLRDNGLEHIIPFKFKNINA
jgi:transposase InsO family protein